MITFGCLDDCDCDAGHNYGGGHMGINRIFLGQWNDYFIKTIMKNWFQTMANVMKIYVKLMIMMKIYEAASKSP